MVQLLEAPTYGTRLHASRPRPVTAVPALPCATYRNGVTRLHLTAPRPRTLRVRIYDPRTPAALHGFVSGGGQSHRFELFAGLATAALASGLWSVIACGIGSDAPRNASVMPSAALPYHGAAGARAVLPTLEGLVQDRAQHRPAAPQSGLRPTRHFKGILCVVDGVDELAIEDPELATRIANLARDGRNHGIAVWLGSATAPAARTAAATAARIARGSDDALVRL